MTAYGMDNSLGGEADVILTSHVKGFYYGPFLALRNIEMKIFKNRITAFIGPSGCGKSTLLRCFNRMNDFVKGARLEGQILFNGRNIFDPSVDAVTLRRQIGMVFQKPNPFAKTIYENIAYGPRINGYKGDMDELVEQSLRRAALWDEVKDKLQKPGTSLSGGQQQRLCIARAIAVQPEVVLMDEPCSALDPISTRRIEDLMQELRDLYTIVIVTHNMQQASRVSDMTAFFNVEMREGSRTGELVEYAPTAAIFQSPQKEATQAYVGGRFG